MTGNVLVYTNYKYIFFFFLQIIYTTKILVLYNRIFKILVLFSSLKASSRLFGIDKVFCTYCNFDILERYYVEWLNHIDI